jgi:hypothetical protein
MCSVCRDFGLEAQKGGRLLFTQRSSL